MLKNLFYGLILICNLNLFSNNKDTSFTKNIFIKGIDFRCGFGNYNTNRNDELTLHKHFNNNASNNLDLTTASMYKGSTLVEPYIGIVFTPQEMRYSKRNLKEEFRLGISYTISPPNTIYYKWDPISTSQNLIKRSYYYEYIYHKQQLNFSYLLNKNIQNSNLAYYLGVGVSFGFVTWRTQFQNNGWTGSSYYNQGNLSLKDSVLTTSFASFSMQNYSSTTAALNIPLGIKYNLSCDLNLFMEFNFYAQYYQTGLYKANAIKPAFMLNLGFRYKIIDEANKEIKKAEAFW